MSDRYGTLDYAAWTKRGFGLGVALFALGAIGGLAGPALFGSLPGWERTLLFDMEVVGTALALLSPFVFGIALPLTE
jgi:hypothetical protein